MIRDPSDGSVRAPRKPLENEVRVDEQTIFENSTSGLPPITKSKADYLKRLEWSRDWLKDYFTPKDSE